MPININTKYRLIADPHNIIVQVAERNSIGDMEWISDCYFSSVENALTWLVQQKVRDSELRDLHTILAFLTAIQSDIKDGLAKIPKETLNAVLKERKK